MAAGVLVVFVWRHVQHRGPHGGPGKAERGQREVAAVVRHFRYGQGTECVSNETAEKRAGEHECRVQTPLRPRHDFPSHRAAARSRRPESASVEKPIKSSQRQTTRRDLSFFLFEAGTEKY